MISRRGTQLRNATDVAAYRRAQSLPRALLHPRIASKVYSLFMRGDYDMAIVYAFREVEVFVRERSRLPATDVGTTLMRRAFNPASGRLTDAKAVDAERNARADLFAGAIGSYKNPLSHRHVPATAEGTIELLFLASHLLRLVEETVPRRSPRVKKGKA